MTVKGMAELNRRLTAITPAKSGRELMTRAAAFTRGQMVRNMPRKTGNTGRSLRVANVTEDHAQIKGTRVVLYLDRGTGLYGPHHQKITPKVKKALRWAAGPAGSLRLSGRIRTGKAGAGAGYIFARSVKGMKARPFIERSVREASQKIGVELTAQVISDWNGAA